MTNCPERTTPGSSRYHCRLDAGLQAEYGPQMTCDAYWTAFYAQDGACGACEQPWDGTPGAPRSENAQNRLSVDHRHVEGEHGPLRGLLCGPCNRLLTEGVTRLVLARPDEDAIVLPGGDVVTASQVAYVRNPPAAGMGIWITKKQRVAGGKKTDARKAGPLKLTGPSLRTVLARRPGPPRYVHTRAVPLVDPAASGDRVVPRRAAYGIPGHVCMPDPWWVRREPRPVEPEPAPEVPGWVPVAARALQVVGVACGVVFAALVVWALVPVLAGVAVLAASGLAAARTSG